MIKFSAWLLSAVMGVAQANLSEEHGISHFDGGSPEILNYANTSRPIDN